MKYSDETQRGIHLIQISIKTVSFNSKLSFSFLYVWNFNYSKQGNIKEVKNHMKLH